MNWLIPTLDAGFDWLWKTSLYASVLVGLVVLIQLMFGKRLPPRWRYALWMLVLVRLLMPVAPRSELSLFNLPARLIPRSPAATATLPGIPANLNEPSPALTMLPPGVTKMRPNHEVRWRRIAQGIWLLGFAVGAFMVLRQHRRFVRLVQGLSRVQDERVLDLLRDCRQTMAVRREVNIAVTFNLGTPALFGYRRPHLLLPEGTLRKLDDRELRMVFLHELAHVKRGDVLLNWVIIGVRTFHWFNPLVWLTMRWLRADRELVCDAIVMSRLDAEERRAYGNTLIKLLDDFSGAGFCPSLAPVINSKHEIKRRVTMIAKFKSRGRFAALCSITIILALAGFTFTRAAVDKPEQKPKETTPGATKDDAVPARGIEALAKELEAHDEKIRTANARMDMMRRELMISDLTDGLSSSALTPQTVRTLEEQRIRVEAEHNGVAALLEGLNRLKQDKGREELRKAILTAVNDELLTKLLQDLFTTEANLAKLRQTTSLDHPEFKSIAAMQKDLYDKVNERMDGILAGLKLKVDAMKSVVESLTKAVTEARAKDAEFAVRFRPYFEAKRELDNLQKARDAILLRILQEKIDAALPQSKSEAK